MLAACGGGIYSVWDTLLRYEAYGVVTGRTIDVSAPLDGVLRYVHVREGDIVNQNARLATVFDLECEQKLQRIADELRVADATLHAEMARIRWQSHVDDTEVTRSMADFFEASGLVCQESGTLDILRDQLQRSRLANEKNAVPASELETRTILERAHNEKLESLRQSLEVLRKRAEGVAQVPRPGIEQMAPLVAKTDLLLNEVERIRQWIEQGDLKAPVNGTVLRRHHPAGECVRSHEPLFTVLEESSTEIEIYVPQSQTEQFKIGETLNIQIEPFNETVPCVVTMVGNEHRRPPEHIEIYYRANAMLLPVRLRPAGNWGNDPRLKIGAVARLPKFNARG